MDKALLVHALGIWAFTSHWSVEDRTVAAEVLMSHMMIDCEHAWARWELVPTFQAQKSVCGKCGKEKEVDAMQKD